MVFWGVVLIDQDNGERVGEDDVDTVAKSLKRIPYARTYTVFNRQQCEDVGETVEDAALAAVETLPEPQAVMDAYLEAEGLKLDHTKFFGASYKPTADRIVLPDSSRFDDMAHYYMTAFHELAHSTGHGDRLAREMDTQFGSHSYGVEELTAEMSAAILGGQVGLTSENDLVENSAAYLKGWLKIIREDPSIVWVAAQRAQKVVDYVMASWERVADAPAVEPMAAVQPPAQPVLSPALAASRAVH